MRNYPNPFSTGSQSGNPVTTISFELKKAGEASVKIYDVMGNEIANPVAGYYPAGRHQFKFDGSNLNSGVYFYTLKTVSGASSRKMTLLK